MSCTLYNILTSREIWLLEFSCPYKLTYTLVQPLLVSVNTGAYERRLVNITV